MKHIPSFPQNYKFEFLTGEDISARAIQKQGMDRKNDIFLIPESLAPTAGKITHLARLLQKEITNYNSELARIKQSEIKRIESAYFEAFNEAKQKRIAKSKIKIAKGYRGRDKQLFKKDGLLNSERSLQFWQEVLKFTLENYPNDLKKITELRAKIQKLTI